MGSPAIQVGGLGGGVRVPGAPQQTMPQDVGMLPVAPLSQVKSGVMPDAARKVAPLGLAMIQRWPPMLSARHGFTADAPPRLSMRTWKPPPSATHLKTVSRE